MDWFWLALLAYLVGAVISVMEMRAKHPEWHLMPCSVAALAWPYLAAVRIIAVLRAARRR